MVRKKHALGDIIGTNHQFGLVIFPRAEDSGLIPFLDFLN